MAFLLKPIEQMLCRVVDYAAMRFAAEKKISYVSTDQIAVEKDGTQHLPVTPSGELDRRYWENEVKRYFRPKIGD